MHTPASCVRPPPPPHRPRAPHPHAAPLPHASPPLAHHAAPVTCIVMMYNVHCFSIGSRLQTSPCMLPWEPHTLREASCKRRAWACHVVCLLFGASAYVSGLVPGASYRACNVQWEPQIDAYVTYCLHPWQIQGAKQLGSITLLASIRRWNVQQYSRGRAAGVTLLKPFLFIKGVSNVTQAVLRANASARLQRASRKTNSAQHLSLQSQYVLQPCTVLLHHMTVPPYLLRSA